MKFNHIVFQDKVTHETGGEYPHNYDHVIDWHTDNYFTHVIYIDDVAMDDFGDEVIDARDIKKVSIPRDDIFRIVVVDS